MLALQECTSLGGSRLQGCCSEASAKIQETRRGPAGTKKQVYLEMSHCRLPVKTPLSRCSQAWKMSCVMRGFRGTCAPVGGFLPSAWPWCGIQASAVKWGRAFLPVTLRLKERVWREWRTPGWNSDDYPATNSIMKLPVLWASVYLLHSKDLSWKISQACNSSHRKWKIAPFHKGSLLWNF